MYRLVTISISLTLSIIDIDIIFLYSTPFRPMCMYAHPLMHPVLLLAFTKENPHINISQQQHYTLFLFGLLGFLDLSVPVLTATHIPYRAMALGTADVRTRTTASFRGAVVAHGTLLISMHRASWLPFPPLAPLLTLESRLG